MSDELFPRRGRHTWWFAIPNPSGHWYVVPGEAEIVDGVFHRIAFPGFETRSGESFGISATFHVLDAIHRDEKGTYGPIRKIVLRNGRLVSSEAVGDQEQIVSFLEGADEPASP